MPYETRTLYDLELIAQNLLQDCKGGKFRRRRVTELQGQGEEVLPRLAKAPLGNTRRRIGETPLTLANNIAGDHVVIDEAALTGMTPLKLTGKLRDRLNNNAKTRQRPHRRTKGCRIHPLTRGVNRKCLHQPIR